MNLNFTDFNAEARVFQHFFHGGTPKISFHTLEEPLRLQTGGVWKGVSRVISRNISNNRCISYFCVFIPRFLAEPWLGNTNTS